MGTFAEGRAHWRCGIKLKRRCVWNPLTSTKLEHNQRDPTALVHECGNLERALKRRHKMWYHEHPRVGPPRDGIAINGREGTPPSQTLHQGEKLLTGHMRSENRERNQKPKVFKRKGLGLTAQ